MTQKDIDKTLTELMKTMDKQLGDLKKLVEKQKIAEEQERMRKIQVTEMCIIGHITLVAITDITIPMTYFF